MKVIDLLNKLANGEETPKKFKIGLINYDFINGNAKIDYELFDCLHNEDYNLNDEVEIIEDTPKEDKKIEKLDLEDLNKLLNGSSDFYVAKHIVHKALVETKTKINEIIEVINERNF